VVDTTVSLGEGMPDRKKAFGTLLERPLRTVGQLTELPPAPRKVVRRFPSPRDRTRAENRDRYNRWPLRLYELEFCCECARTDCEVRLPLGVERHRRWTDRFIVGLAHGDADTVVGVADDFLVVEANGGTPSLYALPLPMRDSRRQTGVA
jgi:hypothetical protein